MRTAVSIALVVVGLALLWDGIQFVNRSLFLDDLLPFGLQYTTLKFAIADRSTIEIVGYGLALFGGLLVIAGVVRLFNQLKTT